MHQNTPPNAGSRQRFHARQCFRAVDQRAEHIIERWLARPHAVAEIAPRLPRRVLADPSDQRAQ
jgi:hypothetical protein